MTFRLIVLATDSNGVYFNSSPATLPGYLTNPSGFVFTPTSNFWGGIQPGVNTGTASNPTAWGIETPLLHHLNALFPGDTFGIIKVSQGQTKLAQSSGEIPDWSPASNGEMFDLTTETIARAKAAFAAAQGYPAPEVSAVVFVGGPNDATSAADAGAYEANLTNAFAAMRDEWMDDPEGKIIFTRMTDAPSLTENFTVRVAQWNVDQADINATSIKTIGMGVQADLFHYDAAGVASIGQAAATIFDGWF